MAQKRASGINKLLNFIGLVDDEEPRDNYGEEYTSGNYGQRTAYVPRNSRPNTARDTRSASSSARRPSANARPSANRTYGEDDEFRPGRTSNYNRNSRRAYEETVEETPRTASRTPRSRFEEEPEPQPQRRESASSAPAPQRNRISRVPRTVMFSLTSLTDCSDVIDQLIWGNTIVLTMDNLDGYLMQRAVDTLSGAVFALRATIRKASDKTYLIAPNGVQVNSTYDTESRF